MLRFMFTGTQKMTVWAAFILAGANAYAQAPAEKPSLGRPPEFIDLDDRSEESPLLDLRYQIGSEWGKKAVTADTIKKGTAAFVRAAKATARVGGATGFYLGTFAGKHIMATNYHVMEGHEDDCYKGTSFGANFVVLKKKYPCKEYLGSWTDIDLALFVIEIPEKDAADLESVAANFDFKGDLVPGQKLVTIGFGVGDNPSSLLMANQDTDCVVFSKKNEFRFMADPDELNPGPYKAWSFANGCDVSHGDSGSAMVDRETSAVVGIIWTGRIPKNKRVQNSDYLKDVVGSDSKDVWSELSYAVPAAKIGDYFEGLIEDKKQDESLVEVLKALTGEEKK